MLHNFILFELQLNPASKQSNFLSGMSFQNGKYIPGGNLKVKVNQPINRFTGNVAKPPIILKSSIDNRSNPIKAGRLLPINKSPAIPRTQSTSPLKQGGGPRQTVAGMGIHKMNSITPPSMNKGVKS